MTMGQQLSLLSTPKGGDKRLVFFDVETLRSADDVGGWQNMDRMGCAVAVCYDSVDRQYYVYQEEEVGGLIERLVKADLIIGFNHLRFDFKVLQPYTHIKLHKLASFDMLEDITKVLGHRVSLDALAKATLKKRKTATGLQSLAWVKEGKWDLVKSYCQTDVEVTRDVYLFGASKGYVLVEKSGKPVHVEVNWALPHIFESLGA